MTVFCESVVLKVMVLKVMVKLNVNTNVPTRTATA